MSTLFYKYVFMLIKDLESLGLNTKEAKVYLAALELGEANMQRISGKSGVKRTTTYDVIESLKLKGFLKSIVKRKKSLYIAEDPRNLQATLEQRLNDQKQAFRKMLPELLSITNLIDRKPKITFYEGVNGIKEIYNDTLKYPDRELLAWVTHEAMSFFDEAFLNDHYLPQRINKKIWVRAIGPNDSAMSGYKSQDDIQLRKTKLVDATAFPLQVEINIYGDSKIGIMSFNEKIGLIIESKKIYTTLKSIFEMSWSK
jgi:HTH-type transcriptional regulator, sugar sensing transcriptional regulator